MTVTRQHDTIVCDLDGVLYVGDEPVPGAGDALAALAVAGYRLLFVTNNSTKHPSILVEQIAALTGYQATVEDVVTSGVATAGYLRDKHRSALVVGEPGLEAVLTEAGVTVVIDWQDAEAVVVGLDRGISYDRLTGATLAVRAGAAFYATNSDATYPAPDGLRPGGGAIAAAVEVATGVAPVVCGKPHPPIRQLVAGRTSSGSVIIVGDRPETDVAMGKAEGWTTVLVLTGVVAAASEVPAHLRPDLLLKSIADLPKALAQKR